MMCTKCGGLVPNGSSFCPNCGTTVVMPGFVSEKTVISNNEQSNSQVNAGQTQTNIQQNFSQQQTSFKNNQDINGGTISAQSIPGDNNVSYQQNYANEVKKESLQKSKNGSKGMAVVGVIALVLLIVGIVGWVLFNKSPKAVFDRAIDYIFNSANKYLVTEGINSLSQNYGLQVELDLSEDILEPNVYAFINNLDIKGNMGLDYQKEIATVSLNANYKNSNLATLSLYAQNSNIYASLGDLLDKYIQVPVDEEEYKTFFEILKSSQKNKDYAIIVNEFQRALKDSLKTEYFTDEKVNVSIDNQTVKATKSTFVLKEETFIKIVRDMLVNLNKDSFIDSLISIYATVSDEVLTKEELQTMLNESIASLDEEIENSDFDEEINIYISLYTSKSEYIKFDIVIENEDESFILLDLVKQKDNIYSFLVNEALGIEILHGQFSVDDKTVNFSVNMNLEDLEMALETKMLENAENDYTIITSVTAGDLGTIKITMDQSLDYNQDINLPNFDQTVLYTDFTESDMQLVLTKFLEKESVKNLMADVQNFMSFFLF